MSHQPGRILVVDDEVKLLEVIEVILTNDGHEVVTTPSGHEALALYEQSPFDLVIMDLKMPAMSGLDLLDHLKSRWPDVLAIVLTAFSTWDSAVEAMRLGAYGYLRKPFDNDDFRAQVNRVLERKHIHATLTEAGVARPFHAGDIIGNSSVMAQAFDVVQRIAPTDSTVVISGESGSGKDLIARAIHYGSLRAAEPFVPVNCGAFTESLLESELFGHVKGSFTGAVHDRKGLFEVAHQGTLFLDEISEMNTATQVKFLRVLESRDIMPVGGSKSIPVDVRIIAATNRDLQALTDEGKFRKDLFYRLDVIRIALPPLRDRREDVPLLAGHFLAKYAGQMSKPIRSIDEDAMELLVAADWPGNVRELENTIQRAVAMTEADRITRMDVLTHALQPPGRERTASASPEHPLSEDGMDLESRLTQVERDYILQALNRSGGNLTHAARMLGLSFRSLRYRVKKLGIGREAR